MSHPAVTSIIKMRDQIRDDFMSHRYEPGIERTYILICELENKDKDTSFKASLYHELALFRNMNQTKKAARIKVMFVTYLAWYEKMNEILWNGGYQSNSKYGVDINEINLEGAEEQN